MTQALEPPPTSLNFSLDSGMLKGFARRSIPMRNTQRSLSWLVIAAFLAIPAMLLAQTGTGPSNVQPRPQSGNSGYHYVFLFDVSGSMNEPGKLGATHSPTRQYLAEHLFSWPDMFHEGQPASVYSFTVSTRPLYSGPLRRSMIQDLLLNGLPVTHENTDLVETLRTAQKDHVQNGNNSVTLAWILTDNANDPEGKGP